MKFELWHRMTDNGFGYSIYSCSLLIRPAAPFQVMSASITRVWYSGHGQLTHHEHEVLNARQLTQEYGDSTAERIRGILIEDGYTREVADV